MHPNIAHLLGLLNADHLPPHLAEIVRPFRDLAECLAAFSQPTTPPGSDPVASYGVGSEIGAALRKLVEAKDCAVRAQVCLDRLRASED